MPASLQRLETPEYATINKMHKVQEENTEDKQWLPSMEDVLGETKIPHTREKPFECKQCGTRFSLRGQLKQHKTTHAGEKRFECNFCLKRFSHKGHFNEHKRIHTGEKPFKCNECEKCFNRKGLLKQHQKLTHQQFNGDTTVQALKILVILKILVMLKITFSTHSPKTNSKSQMAVNNCLKTVWAGLLQCVLFARVRPLPLPTGMTIAWYLMTSAPVLDPHLVLLCH